MAVSEQTPYIEYTANGTTTSFALDFDCDNQNHLIVLIDGIEPVVGAWSLSNGAVVFNTAPENGKKITLQRNTPFSRTTDYQSYNNSFRPSAVNKDFDWIWLKLQELGVADYLLRLYIDRLHGEQKTYIDQKDTQLQNNINNLSTHVDQQDAQLQQNIDNLKIYVDDEDDELRAYLMEEIRKQGVALDQLDEYYNYLMQQLAQIAVDKGWAAALVADSSGMSQQQINDLAEKWHPINVEKFRQAGFSDSQTIQAALDYINDLPFSGTRLIFEAGRLYTYNAEHSIKNINDLVLDLNGATLKRANGSTTSALLAQELTVAGSAGLTLTLDYIPDNWNVGEYLTVFTSDSDQDTSRTRRRITSINRTNNTVKIYAPLEFSPAKTTLPVGTRVAKNFSCFSGRPSSTDSGSYPLEAGINKRIFVTNGTIDGNRANQYNVSWRFITEVGIHSIGGVIDKVHFKNITSETVVGHGMSVQNCIYEDIGGSLYHTSLNDASKAIAGFAWFTNNTVKRCNLETTARIGHSEGAITFSWGAGNFIVKDNVLEDLTECFLGGFSTYTEAHGDEFLMVSGNIVKGAKGLIWGAQEPTRGIHVTGNIFHDCGDNTAITKSIVANPNNSIHGNTLTGNTQIYQQGTFDELTGNTVAFQQGTFDKLKAGVRRDTFGSIDNTVQYSAHSLIPNYLPTLDSGTVTASERNGTNFHAFVSTAGSGTVHYHPNGANSGSAFSTFNPSDKTYVLGTNITDGKVHIKAGGYQDKMRFKSSSVDMPNFSGLVFGADDADGSWRFVIVSNDLVLQRRESGAWVAKQTFSATP